MTPQKLRRRVGPRPGIEAQLASVKDGCILWVSTKRNFFVILKGGPKTDAQRARIEEIQSRIKENFGADFYRKPSMPEAAVNEYPLRPEDCV